METLLCLSVLSLTFLGCYCDNAQPNRAQPRFSGDGGNGNAVQDSNDAEVGQLSGFFNALVNELQNAPQLANGPQAKNKGNGDTGLPAAVADSQPAGGGLGNSPAVTDAPPDDSVTPDMRKKPVTNNINRLSGGNNGGGLENFNPPSPNFNGPNFQGPNFDAPGGNNMYMPPPGMQSPFGPGPFGQGPGGYGGGPYGGGGPYDGNGYGGYDGYNQGPPVTHAPVGNPDSYGPDNSQLQEMGMGQLGKFFSAMVGELQNSGFNNNPKSAIAAKATVKPTTTSTTTTTTKSTTTSTTTEADSE